MHSKLDHENVVRFYETVESSRTINLVMEHISGKSLYAYLKQQKWRRIPEESAKKIFKQMINGLDYIHNKNICHRDLKPDNILLEREQMQVKIIDFGFSVSTEKKLTTFCGTPSYMAPEIVKRKEYSGKSVDLWAAGVILFQMVYGRCPFRGNTEQELYRNIARGQYKWYDVVH